ncbi:MAG TPA: SDR family oxidoreductase [Verrucomicrobiota bacterium]|nr:3-oxoacyl-ACP reductase [Verrucomicrobiales bacterium]HRI12639.1 SDR family oxidoreductase [Verrucomicrobiota bacterium]
MHGQFSRLPVVLLTGASTGLGLATAHALASQACRVALTARAESLPRLAAAGLRESDRLLFRPLDVVERRQRETVVSELTDRWGGIDVLINNAGIAYRAVVEHWDPNAWRNIMEVDVVAALDLTRLVLPGMRTRRSGRILNVSSVGGMMAMPTMSLYSAAKFALEGATESLWYEVRPWGIWVSLIEPGFIRSDSFRNTRFTQRSFSAAMDGDDPYHAHYLHMAQFIERMMERAVATPERVARRILRTLRQRRPPLRVYATPDAHLFALLRRLLPRGLYHGILYRALPHISAWGHENGKPPLA